ncbi:MAG: ABC transporter ATP-binding protein [Thermoleophilia bacterium]|nr:ABC transporter ATP-binding protein [Thermoleophilia bacterium]
MVVTIRRYGREGETVDGHIVLEGVTKAFGENVVVNNVDLSIGEGEFFSMLGPSGCGKTTTLRMIAGFEVPTEGTIILTGTDVTHVPPAKRNVNMVFQAYALFPHMTVQENVEFGLRIKRVKRDEVRARTAEAIESVQLEGFEARKPAQLSGGQQQRVALARALVNRPAALLLDEPLGALDMKLRKEMQHELKAIQVRTGTTFVYVTHDQEEALTMSDRIAVINDGIVEQCAGPREIYEHPSTAFVAGFIGTSNIVNLRVDRSVDGNAVMDVSEGNRIVAKSDTKAGETLRVTVRPEKIHLSAGGLGDDASMVGGRISDVVYLGSMTQIMVDLATGDSLTVHRLNDEATTTEAKVGDTVTLHWAAANSFVIKGVSTIAESGGDSALDAPDNHNGRQET